MAHNLYLQVLLVVLGLYGAIECLPNYQIADEVENTPYETSTFKDTPFHEQVEAMNGLPYGLDRGSVSSKQKRCRDSANTPRHHDKCWNDVCYYSVAIGQQSSDRRIWNKAYHKPKTDQTPIYIDVVYPESISTSDYNITYITLDDSEKSERIYSDDISVKSGGVGYKNVELTIQSNYSNPKDYYYVQIYGKKSKQEQ